MEMYILDSLYRRVHVVDKFESFIWAERFSAYGDFKLTLNSTVDNRRLLVPGTRVACDTSYRIADIETVEDSTDDEGRAILIVSGRTKESILEDRVARGDLEDLTETPKWILEGLPAAVARQMYNDICVDGVLDPGDIITSIIEGSSIFPEDTIPEPLDEIIYGVEPKTLYVALKELCDIFGMGFRIVRDPISSLLYFDVYMGSDRTTKQSILPAVVFSPDLDNLKNTSSLTSIALYKNVAYVFSPVGYEIVYPLDVDPAVEGFDRRVLVVKADDITDPDGPTASAQMIQRGVEELAKARRFSAFDGTLTDKNQYKYGVDYNLGDLVEKRNVDGVTSVMQVTEQIMVSDKEGERSYPTLSLNNFITPGSWASVNPSIDWDDMDEDEFWDNQP